MSQAEALAYAARLSRILARRMRIDPDDARQIAQMAALRALERCDGVRQPRRLVRVCVRNALADEYRRETYRSHSEFKFAPVACRAEQTALCAELLRKLNPRERRVVVGWMAGELDAEQAERMGRHFTVVSRIRSAALAKLREVA